MSGDAHLASQPDETGFSEARKRRGVRAQLLWGEHRRQSGAEARRSGSLGKSQRFAPEKRLQRCIHEGLRMKRAWANDRKAKVL
jgi:hypothetical protein